MAATLQWYQTNGASPGVDTPQGTTNGLNNWDFKSVDTAGPAIAGEEITAGNFSFTIWTKARFTGSFSSITNVKFYASTLNVSGYGTNAYILASGYPVAGYITPAAASMSGTWHTISGTALNGQEISTATLAAGTAGFTDYASLQLKTMASGADVGYGGYTSFTMVYDEV